jgi:hypothetical protein
MADAAIIAGSSTLAGGIVGAIGGFGAARLARKGAQDQADLDHVRAVEADTRRWQRDRRERAIAECFAAGNAYRTTIIRIVAEGANGRELTPLSARLSEAAYFLNIAADSLPLINAMHEYVDAPYAASEVSTHEALSLAIENVAAATRTLESQARVEAGLEPVELPRRPVG